MLRKGRSKRPPNAGPEFLTQVKQKLIGAQARHTLDEAGFQQLLAAAFVVQQHNDRLRLRKSPGVSYTKTLAEIVETEDQVKNGHLSLQSSLRLILERARRFTRAEAAAIAIAENGYLVYRATSGRCLDEVGSRTRLNAAVAAKCLSGGLLQSPDTTNDRNLDSELCWGKGIRSLLAAPITYDEKVIGVLELRFANPNGYREEDVRTCELLAGLVTVALRNERNGGQQRLLAQRNEDSAMRRAVEKITPQLERLLDEPDPDFVRAGAALSGEIMGAADWRAPAKDSGNREADRHKEHQAQSEAGRKNGSAPSETFKTIEAHGAEVLPTETPQAKPLEPVLTNLNFAPAVQAPAPEVYHPEVARPEVARPEVHRDEVHDDEKAAKESSKPFISVAPVVSSQVPEAPAVAPVTVPAIEASAVTEACQNCGRDFVGDESICGVCGTSRSDEPEAASTPVANTWASLWDLQQETEPVSEAIPAGEVSVPALSDFALSNPAEAGENRGPFLGNLYDIRDRFTGRRPQDQDKGKDKDKKDKQDQAVEARAQAAAPYREEVPAESELSSFSSLSPEVPAGEDEVEDDAWAEPSAGQRMKEFWDHHRATIYLGIAAILLLMVLLGWGEQPAPVAASGATQASASAGDDLTLFEKMLVGMGLAEAPTPDHTNPGNPDARVWEDVHTALYYCPGSDLYGKTKGGKYTTQKEAQQDQFEPAGRRACR